MYKAILLLYMCYTRANTVRTEVDTELVNKFLFVAKYHFMQINSTSHQIIIIPWYKQSHD